MYAQKQVTTFLGIPVDGTKAAMMTKLKAKGFKQIDSETLTGTFNGEDARVGVVTYKGKVCRISVFFTTKRDEQQIKAGYNKLINQFSNNARYESRVAELLAEDEDISYQMITKNKSYEAGFCQLPEDENMINRVVWFKILGNIPDYYIALFYDNKLNEAQGEDL